MLDSFHSIQSPQPNLRAVDASAAAIRFLGDTGPDIQLHLWAQSWLLPLHAAEVFVSKPRLWYMKKSRNTARISWLYVFKRPHRPENLPEPTTSGFFAVWLCTRWFFFFISLSVEFAQKTSSLASMLLFSAYLVSVMFLEPVSKTRVYISGFVALCLLLFTHTHSRCDCRANLLLLIWPRLFCVSMSQESE